MQFLHKQSCRKPTGNFSRCCDMVLKDCTLRHSVCTGGDLHPSHTVSRTEEKLAQDGRSLPTINSWSAESWL